MTFCFADVDFFDLAFFPTKVKPGAEPAGRGVFFFVFFLLLFVVVVVFLSVSAFGTARIRLESPRPAVPGGFAPSRFALVYGWIVCLLVFFFLSLYTVIRLRRHFRLVCTVSAEIKNEIKCKIR